MLAMSNGICHENRPSLLKIELTANYDNKGDVLKPRSRSIESNPIAYIDNHVITFEYFEYPLLIEIVDVSNNIIFSKNILNSVQHTIEIPNNIKGTFIIRFKNGNAEYWGYINL